MNEGTPSGSEYNKPMAVMLKGPTAKLYLTFSSGDSELVGVSSGWITSPSLSEFGGSYSQGLQTCPFSVGVCSLSRELAFIRSSLLQRKLHCPGITNEDVRKSDLLAELTDVISDGVTQDLWIFSIGIDINRWDIYQQNELPT
jgi:hypothetical protein